MNLTLTVVLALAGLIAIFAALLGNILWVDGKPRGEIRDPRIRLGLGLLGAALIGSSSFLAVRLAPVSKCPVCNEFKQKIDTIESEQKRITYVINLMEGDIEGLRKQDEIGVDLTREMLSKVSCIRDNNSLDACARRYRDGRYASYEKPDVNIRDFAIALWEVDVVIPLGSTNKKALEKQIGDLNIGVFVNSIGRLKEGQRDTGRAVYKNFRGIVVDDNIPREMVCRVKDIFEKQTSIKINAITSAARYRERLGIAGPFHRISLGVPFDLYFSKESIRTDIDWDSLCSDDYDQDAYVRVIEDLGEKLKKLHVPDEMGGEG